MKILNRLISIILITVIGGLALLHFLPGYNIYLVRSESMRPAINIGDMIINGPSNDVISPGTILTYQRGKELITHRVLSIDGDIITTKGDAAEDPDPWSVSLFDVKGTYLVKIPSIGYLLNFARTKSGWFMMIIIPSAALVALLIKEIVKEALSSC